MDETLSIIPRPQRMTAGAGAFTVTRNSRILLAGEAPAEMGDLLAGFLHSATGLTLPVVEGENAANDLIVLRQTGSDIPDDKGFFDESHKLRVGEAGIELIAATSHGLARGLQTLRQVLLAVSLPEGGAAACRIPAVEIEDAPRFRWRGMMLDVARHFFKVGEVCRFIDLIALHRFNRLHLHLSDDQGWRVEIQRYPRLTEVGSTRPRTLTGHERLRPRRYDGQPYGGYFTRDDVRRIVAYARLRRIELVPEIDMPGHMQAAIAAYPELGNTNAAVQPRCHWGISQHILNAEETTIDFMANVLGEIMDLFPGRYIHVGGDEALKHEWCESPRIQARMHELGLENESALQSWFIRRMGRFIASCGRVTLGWDEILEGGELPPGAVVVSWRGEKGGIEAVQKGHDVVMAPSAHVYFDYYQSEPLVEEPLAIGGLATASHVYAYEPIPALLREESRGNVLGSQGQLWSEYIPDAPHLDYMAFPRACALAEVLWLQPERKNYRDFLQRLKSHRRRLAKLEVNAHPLP